MRPIKSWLRQALLGAGSLAAIATAGAAQDDQTLLLRDPAIAGDQIAFIYAGDIYVANIDGSGARRLTSSPESEVNPRFSPDGSMIAYTANFEGNADVYVIPTAGGQPTRLTWHAGTDTVLDWAPDGSAVAFASARERDHGRSQQLYHVSVSGGLPSKQMDARIFRGQYNDNARLFAYTSFGPAYNGLYGGSSGWQAHRGGTAPDIWVYDKRRDRVTEIPGDEFNDIEPMFVGDAVYFLSDREDKTLNLYRFDDGDIERLTNETEWDIRAADADGNRVIYEVGGRLKLYDVGAGSSSEIRISLSPDLPQKRTQWKKAGGNITAASLSPSAKRVAITARGDVFTVPIEDGTTRNLTRTGGAREYTALWSPDGQQVAYIDAATGDQVLVVADQFGAEVARHPLDGNFNFLRVWGGEGDKSHIAVSNNKSELKLINTTTGAITAVSTGTRRFRADVAFSHDGSWLAFTEDQMNFNTTLSVYNVATGETHMVANRFADSSNPSFSTDGKYLFFTASTNVGPRQVGLDMSSQERPYRAGIYAAVLGADAPSPLAPKTGDEDAKKDDAKSEDAEGKSDDTDEAAEDTSMTIDVEGLMDRIVALPVGEKAYDDLVAGSDGALYYLLRGQPGAQIPATGERQSAVNHLMRFDFKDKASKSLMTGVTTLITGSTQSHLLIGKGPSWSVAKVGKSLDAKPVKTGDMRMRVEPMSEWAQMFDEAWRMESAYFYDPNMHGLDWQGVYDRYRPLVDHVGRREDLNALIVEMIAEMEVGHNRAGGGDVYSPERAQTGALGANYAFENGRTRITKIYSGEHWNPNLKGPLSEPGLGVTAGDYILAVNGLDLGEGENIHAHLQNTVGKQVTLSVTSNADGSGARDIVVEPISSEFGLRLWNWVETNRKAVEEATDGKVGYVYLPNTAGAGYTFFNRMFFAQTDKDAMIIDERSNGGGQAANYITDVLSRTYLSGWKDSVGATYNTPGGAMYGPKVMLIDQDAGSGGDFLPYSFRQMEIGPLVGTRTWGGLIGIFANPLLIDGGFLTVPNFRYFDANYEWTVENQGVAPDIEVKLDPVMTNKGRDSQLERAIEVTLERLKTNPSPVPTEAPAYPTEVGQ